jgi:2-oxoisovalerate dehydrogenase E1 component alpha subunit
MDHYFNEAQRQGSISFYMQASGEEAIHFGTASCLRPGMLRSSVIVPASLSSLPLCAHHSCFDLHTCFFIAIADDEIFAQYREAGVLMWRGFTIQNFADQVP